VSPETPRLWLVSPVYRDSESFEQLRENLLATLRPLAYVPGAAAPRFVLIDDSGGTDPDVERLRQKGDVRVITTPFNLGHQRALVFGLRTLERDLLAEDVVVTLDGDGEDRPQDLPALLAELLGPGRPALVLARRTSRHVSLRFRMLYFFFKLLFRSLTGVLIRTGNYAAFRGSLVSRVLFHPHFDLCYSASLISLNLDVRFVACPRGRRYAGHSRMDYFRLVRHGISMLMPFLDRIAVRALLAFSFTFGAGLSLSLLVLGLLAFSRTAFPWWVPAALAASLLLSLIALGNFLVLFATYAQSQSASLRSLDRGPGRELGEPRREHASARR
jgi:glycosyltransferase involved in cell wall biosynthesis